MSKHPQTTFLLHGSFTILPFHELHLGFNQVLHTLRVTLLRVDFMNVIMGDVAATFCYFCEVMNHDPIKWFGANGGQRMKNLVDSHAMQCESM